MGACLRDLSAPSTLLCLWDFPLGRSFSPISLVRNPRIIFDSSFDSATRSCFCHRSALTPAFLWLLPRSWSRSHRLAWTSRSSFPVLMLRTSLSFCHLTAKRRLSCCYPGSETQMPQVGLQGPGSLPRAVAASAQLHTHLLCTGGYGLCGRQCPYLGVRIKAIPSHRIGSRSKRVHV